MAASLQLPCKALDEPHSPTQAHLCKINEESAVPRAAADASQVPDWPDLYCKLQAQLHHPATAARMPAHFLRQVPHTHLHTDVPCRNACFVAKPYERLALQLRRAQVASRWPRLQCAPLGLVDGPQSFR